MFFVNNSLTLTNKSGFSLQFNAKDALKEVPNQCDIKVAYSQAWMKR